MKKRKKRVIMSKERVALIEIRKLHLEQARHIELPMGISRDCKLCDVICNGLN